MSEQQSSFNYLLIIIILIHVYYILFVKMFFRKYVHKLNFGSKNLNNICRFFKKNAITRFSSDVI